MAVLAVTEQGTHVTIDHETLVLLREGEVLRRVRLVDVEQLLLFGRIELTSAALAALVRKGIDVVFLTVQGNFRARLLGRGARPVTLRLAQMRRGLDPVFRAVVARGVIAGKVRHQRYLLLRAQRRLRDPLLAEVLARLRVLVEQLPSETDIERLRGLEGQAAALYFGQFGKLLGNDAFSFTRRSRRPPRDPVNACLSFGYALLGTAVETEIVRVGLDPYVGMLHEPLDGRPSLMLDLLEEFRPFVDGLVVRLINRRQLAAGDFEQRGGPELAEILSETPDDTPAPLAEEAAAEAPRDGGPGIYLADVGRRVFLAEFFQRLRERLYYPPRRGSYELRDIIREQAHHLARVIEGEEPAYVAFVPD